jgi:hypothetical protein
MAYCAAAATPLAFQKCRWRVTVHFTVAPDFAMLRAPWWGLRTSYRHFSAKQKVHEVLVRDWIRSSLYQSKTGYFHQDVINTLPQPLAFKGMVGESDYRKAVAKVRCYCAFNKLKRNMCNI